MYYRELLQNEYVGSKTELAQKIGISRTQTRLILRLTQLDREIRDFILRLDDSDPRLDLLSVYRLQPILGLRARRDKEGNFGKMIEE